MSRAGRQTADSQEAWEGDRQIISTHTVGAKGKPGVLWDSRQHPGAPRTPDIPISTPTTTAATASKTLAPGPGK